MPLDDEFVEVVGLGGVESSEREVVEDEDVDAGELADLGLERATEHAVPVLPAAAGSPGGRFARDPGEYDTSGGARLTLLPGGKATTTTTPAPEGDPS